MEVSLGKIVGDLAEAARDETVIAGSLADETDAGAETEEESGIGKTLKPGEEGESEAEGSVVAGTEKEGMDEDEDEGDVTIRPSGEVVPGSEDEDEL